MFIKKSHLFVATILAATTIVFSSCKKNEEASIPAGQEQVSNGTGSGSNTYTITSHDGHTIGINGVNQGSTPGSGSAMSGGCAASNAPGVGALSGFYLSNGSIGCVLSDTIPGGSGQCFALFINGVAYRDPSSGFALFNLMFTTINAECSAISGGIQPGETFHNFVRMYCNADTTGSPYYDSPIKNYTVPSTFNSTCGGSTGGTTTTTKGH